MKVLLLLLLVVVASCVPSYEGLKSKLHSATSSYCRNPSPQNRFKLQNFLNVYESHESKREEVASSSRGVLDGTINCQDNGQKRSTTSDVVSVSCPTTAYDVGSGSVSFDCSFSIEIDEGIYYYEIYAYIYVASSSLEVTPSTYYFYDTSASTTIQSGTTTFTLPQYAPSGTWTVYVYAYNSGFATDYYATTTFTVAATTNDAGPPVLTSLSLPYVDTISSLTASISFSATDDLSGFQEFYVYFYDSSYTNYLGSAYWSTSTPFILSVSESVIANLNNVPFGAYQPIVELYDHVGLYADYYSAALQADGFSYQIINAGNNCTAGRYLPVGASGACLTCPAGTYSPYGSIACLTCPPGYKGNGKGASSCIACAAGYFSNGGSAGCSLCPAGKYSSAGAGVCTPCQPGYYSATTGSTSCTGCDAGTHSCGGATSCTACAAGTYSTGYSSFCYQCVAGTFADSAGESSCSPCAAGTYSNKPGSTSCTSCPTGETSPAGSNAALACV